jgi:hypothetical protein
MARKPVEIDDSPVSFRINYKQKVLLDALAVGSSRTEVLRRAFNMYLGASLAERRREFENSMPQTLARLAGIHSVARRTEPSKRMLDAATTDALLAVIERLNHALDELEERNKP